MVTAKAWGMSKRKRHSSAEVAAKLAEASAMAAQGKRQQEIAHTLGISVMTFHRWRKAHLHRNDDAPIAPVELREFDSLLDHGLERRIAELQLENSRLRRLVTDLLLEKVKLEEVEPAAEIDTINQASH
jgi:putative transposase